ncbi:TMEM43 family protein [Pseudodesulfovibrio sediminis]|uniref:Uncharacterized protein n=1 Tax=Pseudodesulfovibrio sediminis TaxID=2810563 RepID=A0ABN6EXW9_9BACT|nr:TMEM43 family protein [Pseudodesulfovibrio sediminis]BCS89861.1 hypothetical protein PSDVSF_31030 [Pseudodesulfovibrio sediminis]
MDTMPMRKCQRRLALLWLGLGGASILIVIIQLAGNHFGEDSNGYAQKAFQWLLPAIVPTLSLILGSLATPMDKERQADSFFFWVTMAISGGYLLIILGFLVTRFSVASMVQMVDSSVLWIGPLQGLVGGTMGFFFFREAKNE